MLTRKPLQVDYFRFGGASTKPSGRRGGVVDRPAFGDQETPMPAVSIRLSIKLSIAKALPGFFRELPQFGAAKNRRLLDKRVLFQTASLEAGGAWISSG
jgi:hypothetical protein